MKVTNEQLKLAANTIRCLAADEVEQAKSGHPGVALGIADLVSTLWLKFIKYDPTDPKWPDRDRLVFSGGHGSSLVYALLHLSGVGKLSLDELKTFRQLGSRCAGHPERGLTPGVEVTTGPLGQGIAMGVGLAIAERMQAARDGEQDGVPVNDHRTWVFCGDGDLEEGISHEACSLAGKLKLDKLTLVYDSNNITIEGTADIALADDTQKRFESYGWKVFSCDGHDYDAIDRTYRKAMKVVGQPTLIIAKTHIGFGAPTKHDTSAVHGAPLGAEELAGLKTALGFDPAQFFEVPGEVLDVFEDRGAACHRMNLRWKKLYKTWQAANPEKAAAREAAARGSIPQDIATKLPVFDPAKPIATRVACGMVMNALASEVPFLVGGSADLEPSNKTALKEYGWIAPGDFSGRNFHFGIRELGMSAIVNGITAHGGFRAFGATFAVFSDYCKPAMRLAALMNLPSIWVFSHDSFYVGEDGPTHEPVEQIASLRATPNLLVFRPADPNETGACWVEMLKRKDGPSCILTTRQNVPVLEGVTQEKVSKGAYVIYESGPFPELMFIATGSEVSLCIEAAKRLAEAEHAVRVVSMPCRKLFEQQPLGYRESVIPGTCPKRVIVEAGVRLGWDRYVTNYGNVRFITLDTFGASGPYKVLAEHFGFTAENVLAKARELL
ncbi:MAG: transketolase [Kiritimatiellae bacterium]|nr:transketolase [Kiritimatiellia bacterium]